MKRTHHHTFHAVTMAIWACLLFSLPLHAEPVARVLFAQGNVQAHLEGISARNINRGDMLHRGETIQTGKGSSVQFRFTDGALIALRAETDFNIEQHHYDEQNPQQNEQSGQLLRGGLRAITGAIGRERPEAVNVRTPVATIGIRGTVYETFYIPPEGHPSLPGVAPGHYLLILRGRVAMINPAGELVISDGEIAYTPNADSPPTLRPDLAGLFAQFSAVENEEELTVVEIDPEPETGDIDNVLTDTASGTGIPTAGPFALAVFAASDESNPIAARFVSQVVSTGTLGNDVYLSSASGGQGDFSTIEAPGSAFTISDPGASTIGDSAIYWGGYVDSTIDGSLQGDAYYIIATQVLVNTSDLPTTGGGTYNYVGGSGTQLDSSSKLTVDFGTSTMNVYLETSNNIEFTANGKNIGDFYGSGISLAGINEETGTIAGRFVGSNADGAISYFILDTWTTGTAAFSK